MPATTLPKPFGRLATPAPLRALLRATGQRLLPSRPLPHQAWTTRAADAVLARGLADTRHRAEILCEARGGDRPTIVLGGFVPDSTEQVYLLRGELLRHGSVYYFNYPRRGFSLELLCAQLDDLVTELEMRRGHRPVILGVSFGAGLLIEWLRRARAAGREPAIAGAVLVGPVACSEDIVELGAAKQSTLLGRALGPFLDARSCTDAATVDRARALFSRMFEAGAQNRAALGELMSPAEAEQVRSRVAATLRAIEADGARERVAALAQLVRPEVLAASGPLTTASVLVLYAENESAVIRKDSPTRSVLEGGACPLFSDCRCRVVSGGKSPVQHASLIFHYPQFLPHFAAFYRESKPGKFVLAA